MHRLQNFKVRFLILGSTKKILKQHMIRRGTLLQGSALKHQFINTPSRVASYNAVHAFLETISPGVGSEFLGPSAAKRQG